MGRLLTCFHLCFVDICRPDAGSSEMDHAYINCHLSQWYNEWNSFINVKVSFKVLRNLSYINAF